MGGAPGGGPPGGAPGGGGPPAMPNPEQYMEMMQGMMNNPAVMQMSQRMFEQMQGEPAMARMMSAMSDPAGRGPRGRPAGDDEVLERPRRALEAREGHGEGPGGAPRRRPGVGRRRGGRRGGGGGGGRGRGGDRELRVGGRAAGGPRRAARAARAGCGQGRGGRRGPLGPALRLRVWRAGVRPGADRR